MYKYVLVLFLVCSINISLGVERITYEGFKGISVTGEKDLLEKVRIAFEGHEGIIFLEEINNEHNYLVSPNYVHKFETEVLKNNLQLDLVHEDFSKIIELENKSVKLIKGDKLTWNAYYDVDTIYKYLNEMSDKYPNTTKLVKGGESYEGRPILGLRVMTPYEEDMDKPAIFIESGIHAREWITPATTTYFINQLVTSSDPDMIHLREKFDWHIFPTVNPDGYHYSHTVDRFWRKTRSRSDNGCFGADPNRNWDHNWNEFGTSDNPCDYQVFAGKTPFSEIETKSLSGYITGVRNLMVYLAYHADAQMLLVPYSDSVDHEDNYDDLVKIGKTSIEYGERVNGAKYRGPGTAAEIIYKASGGSMDWVREALATPIVYTYELRGRYFHWPPHRIPEQGEEVAQMIVGLVAEAENMKYL